MHQENYPQLSCPIIRPARASDAEELADLILNTDSEFIESVFGDNYFGGLEVLKKQFRDYNDGIYVLKEGIEIIGVMKLHLPDKMIGKTISYVDLIKILGIKNGIKAGILLSSWDEYKLSPGEAYLEYIYIPQKWRGKGMQKMLLSKAIELAKQSDAKYITYFIPTSDHKRKAYFENYGFFVKRKIYSPLALLLGSNHKSWYKTSYYLLQSKNSVKEFVSDKFESMRTIWKQRKREMVSAIRITLILTIFPVISGGFAVFRGYTIAAIFWAFLATFHLVGVKLYLKGSILGKLGITAALFPEGLNLVRQAFTTSSWWNRSWSLPLALVLFWICYVILTFPQDFKENLSEETKIIL